MMMLSVQISNLSSCAQQTDATTAPQAFGISLFWCRLHNVHHSVVFMSQYLPQLFDSEQPESHSRIFFFAQPCGIAQNSVYGRTSLTVLGIKATGNDIAKNNNLITSPSRLKFLIPFLT